MASCLRTHQSCVPIGIGFHAAARGATAGASTTEAAAAPPSLRASRRVSGPALMNQSLLSRHPMSVAGSLTTARCRTSSSAARSTTPSRTKAARPSLT